jgi:hypothetical protein
MVLIFFGVNENALVGVLYCLRSDHNYHELSL